MKDPNVSPASGGKDKTVGYGNPPVEGQFPKGKSGNPKGRPKGAKNKVTTEAAKLVDLVRKEAAREITMGADGERMTMQQAAIRSTMVNAVKGKTHAQRHATSLIQMAERDEVKRAERTKACSFEVLQAAIDLKAQLMILDANCQAVGMKYPDELPRPEDVILSSGPSGLKMRHPVGERAEQLWKCFWAQKHHLLLERSLLWQNTEDTTFDIATRDQFETLSETCDRLLDMVIREMWQIWRVAPDDTTGPVCDIDDLAEQEGFGDTTSEGIVGMAQCLLDLQNARRLTEVKAGKITGENEAVSEFWNRAV